MKSQIRFFIIFMSLLQILSACGHKDEQEVDTEKLVVGAGVAFESEDATKSEQTEFEMELSAADLEGMTESIVRTVKDATIYAKPSSEASVIGGVDARTNIGVYGLTEDESWMVVSFYGRVGYVKADVFEREVVQTQNVIVPTQPSNSNQRPSAGNTNSSAGSSQKPTTQKPSTDSSQKPSADSSEKPSTQTPSVDSSEAPSTEKPSTEKPSTEKPSTENEDVSDLPGAGEDDEETIDPPTEDGGENSEDTNPEAPDLPSDGDGSNEGEEPPQDNPESPELPDGIEEVIEGIE